MLHSTALPCTPHLNCEVGKAKGVLIPHSNVAAGLVGHMHLRGQQQKAAAAEGSRKRQQQQQQGRLFGIAWAMARAAAAGSSCMEGCRGGHLQSWGASWLALGKAEAAAGAEPTNSACLVALFDEPNEGATHGDDVVIRMRGEDEDALGEGCRAGKAGQG